MVSKKSFENLYSNMEKSFSDFSISATLKKIVNGENKSGVFNTIKETEFKAFKITDKNIPFNEIKDNEINLLTEYMQVKDIELGDTVLLDAVSYQVYSLMLNTGDITINILCRKG